MTKRHDTAHASLFRDGGQYFVSLAIGNVDIPRGRKEVHRPAVATELTPRAAEMLLYDLHSISQTLRGVEKPVQGGRMRKAYRALRGR